MEDGTTLAGHPSAVRTFLMGLLDAVKAPADIELQTLQQVAGARPSTGALEAWDHQFYRTVVTVGPRHAAQHCLHSMSNTDNEGRLLDMQSRMFTWGLIICSDLDVCR